jgi:hypothetical protein
VRPWLSAERAGKWLLVLDNANDPGILFGSGDAKGIIDYFPESEKGAAKPTRPRGRLTRLEASKGVMDKLKDARGRPRKLQMGDELEVLVKDNLIASNETNPTTVNESGALRDLAVNSLSSS